MSAERVGNAQVLTARYPIFQALGDAGACHQVIGRHSCNSLPRRAAKARCIVADRKESTILKSTDKQAASGSGDAISLQNLNPADAATFQKMLQCISEISEIEITEIIMVSSRINSNSPSEFIEPLPWYDWTGPMHYISHLYYGLGRVGADLDTDLLQYQFEILQDLEDLLNGSNDVALGKIFEWQSLDFDALLIPSQSAPNRGRYRKPKIDLSAEITSKKNLSVKWYPSGILSGYTTVDPVRGIEEYHPSEAIDWRNWRVVEPDAGFERASNELMFVHQVGSLEPKPESPYRRITWQNDGVVDQLLLAALVLSFRKLVKLLQNNFEVTLLNDFELMLTDMPGTFGPIKFITDWKIYNVRAREREQQETRAREQRERLRDYKKWVDGFAAAYGISIEQFLGLFEPSANQTKFEARLKPETKAAKLGWPFTAHEVNEFKSRLDELIQAGMINPQPAALPPLKRNTPARIPRKPKR